MLASAFWALACAHPLEQGPLDARARSEAPGRFAQLEHGWVHFVADEPAGVARGTVVLVHGFSVPSYTWERTAPALAGAGFRVLRFDAYGRGFSARPRLRYDRDLYASQLADLLRALEIDGPVDLVGLSMGGRVVAAFAADHPERVRRVALLAPSNRPAEIGPLAWPGVGEFVAARSWVPTRAEAQLEDFVQPEAFPEWPERYRTQMRIEGFGRSLLSTLRHTLATDPSDDYRALGRSGAPVLLVWGDLDPVVPIDQAEALRALIGGSARVVPITGASHALHYEQAPRVNRELVEFLSARSPNVSSREGP